MPIRLWIGLSLVLGLTWLEPDMRKTVVSNLGLHLVLAFGCGLGAIALNLISPGVRRRAAVVLLLLLSWVLAVSWQYVYRSQPENFSWPGAVVVGLGVTVLPVTTGAVIGRVRGGRWALVFVQVCSLSILEAPLSSLVAFGLALWVIGE